MGRQRAITDPDVAKALGHPLRMRLLAILEERTASPSELAELTAVSLPRVSYHVRRLAAADLIELVSTQQRRGAIEHYYAAVAQDELDGQADGGAALPSADGATAAAATDGASDGASDGAARVPGQIPLTLDDRGWKQLRRRMELLREDIENITMASRKRLDEAGGAPARHGHAIVLLVEDGSAAHG